VQGERAAIPESDQHEPARVETMDAQLPFEQRLEMPHCGAQRGRFGGDVERIT
jgi:hypothetical protein